MFSSTILDVAAGLVFVFFVVSLSASALLEAVASMIGWRSGTLLQGVKDLMNDPQFTGLAAQLYQHALINPRSDGSIPDAPAGATAAEVGQIIEKSLRKNAPSYIDPQQFADALFDILNTGGPSLAAAGADPRPGKMRDGDAESIVAAIDHVVPADANAQINALLHGIARRSGDDLTRMKAEAAAWFDHSMDRLSGVYKRWTQLWHFLIALGVAILLNISAIHVATVLWKQPEAAKALGAATVSNSTDAVAAVRQLDSLALPIGWTNYRQPLRGVEGVALGPSWGDAPEMFVGWLITALAALFGAPFWFDLLQTVIRLKGAGPSPAEKRRDSAAAS